MTGRKQKKSGRRFESYTTLEIGNIQIQAEPFQWVIRQKPKGKEKLKVLGYYSTFSDMIVALSEMNLRRVKVSTLEDLLSEQKKFSTFLEDTLIPKLAESLIAKRSGYSLKDLPGMERKLGRNKEAKK